ncbi:MAG: hypothetical protein QOK43_2778 [Acidimicrobiaceae bacterium]|nr:hypothetical protein [Acidimicrobiaceae bacterium]
MPHMVIFRSAEGKPGYHQAESLDEAVRFVEHLRNQENVPESRIFRMQEVPIEFKTYVKVEVTGMDAGPVAAPTHAPAPAVAEAAPAAPAPVAAAAPVVEEPRSAPADKGDDVVVDPMPVGQGANASNRFGRFNRG